MRGCLPHLALTILLSFGLAVLAPPVQAADPAADIERASWEDPKALLQSAKAALDVAAKTATGSPKELLGLRQYVAAIAMVDRSDTRPQIDRGLQLAEQLGDREAKVELLRRKALLAEELLDSSAAVLAHREAEAVAVAVGRPFHVIRAKLGAANWQAEQGWYADALAKLDEAYKMAERERDPFAVARILSLRFDYLNRTDRLGKEGGLTRIMERHQQVLDMIPPGSYRLWILRRQYALAQVLRSEGFTDEARRVLREGLASAKSYEDAAMQVYLLQAAAQLEVQAGDPAAALPYLDQAKQGLAKVRLPTPLLFRTALDHARALARTGQRAPALAEIDAAAAMLKSLDRPRYRSVYFRAASETKAALGDFEGAYQLAVQWNRAERAAIDERNDGLVTELQMRFDAERKENENAELRAQQRDLETRRWIQVLSLAAAALLCAGLALALRLRMQARLRVAAALQASVVDNAMDAIVTVDRSLRIVEFNRAAETMLSISRAEAVGRPFDLFVPETHRLHERECFQELLRGRRLENIGRRRRLRALRADGSEITIEMVLWQSHVEQGVHVTASMRDITEQQRSAEIIERQRDELRQSEKLSIMGTLLAGVAHELNNPLSVVMGRAALLEEMCNGTDMEREARRVREAAVRCGGIVRTFLNMARQRSALRGRVQLNDAAREAADMLGYSLRTQAIRVQLDLAADMPMVEADSDQIGQVVLNLVINAQHAMDGSEGERRLVVRSGWEPAEADRGARAWLEVQDTGPGVPPELRDQIFLPFFTTKGEGKGTGLGLAVSRAIARDHGGDLLLEHVEGGACFRLWLPLKDGASVSGYAFAQLADEVSGGRILVIDDEADLAELMQQILERAGFEVATALSGTDALEMLDHLNFDAVVCDIRMPDVDGPVLWRHASRRGEALARRILFVTGDTLSVDVRRFIEETGCLVLDKPFSADDLCDKVRRVMRDGEDLQRSAAAAE